MKKLLAIVMMSALLLVGCSKGNDKPEKERFIDATIEAACMVFDEGVDLTDPDIDWEAKTKEVFEKHGFPANDDAQMEEIAGKYENDEEVQKAVEAALQDCAGDLMKAFGDAFEAPAEEGEEAVEEEAAEPTEEAAPSEEAKEEETKTE